jgi:hypothetical protein
MNWKDTGWKVVSSPQEGVYPPDKVGQYPIKEHIRNLGPFTITILEYHDLGDGEAYVPDVIIREYGGSIELTGDDIVTWDEAIEAVDKFINLIKDPEGERALMAIAK